MTDDLSIQLASSMMQMLASKGSSELGVRLMKLQAQQDQAVVAMVANQVALIRDGGYDSHATSVPPVGQGTIDAAV